MSKMIKLFFPFIFSYGLPRQFTVPFDDQMNTDESRLTISSVNGPTFVSK